jgi:predicted CxxxxCH...CXXCH cytochrome family protein
MEGILNERTGRGKMEKTNREKALSSDHMKPEDRQRIEAYVDQLKLDDPVPVEVFRKIVRGLIGARGLYLYFVWQVLKDKGLDADALVQEACRRWGVYNGTKLGKEIKTPADFLTKWSSKTGTLAWDQHYTQLNDEQASKEFNYCPLIAAFKEAGVSDRDIVSLCRNMLCHGDYGTAAPQPVNLEWVGSTIGEGSKTCHMLITRKRKEVK